MNNIVYNEDCMAGMARYPNGYFDLAVVDPPYGINVHQNFGIGNRNDKQKDYKKWDIRPNNNYFIELKRVSKEQIIWGANYLNCFSKKGGAIVWNKLQPLPDSSQCEIASYSRVQKVFLYEQRWTNFVNTKGTEHPTEKPIELYAWLYRNFAKQGMKILDTHVGSGSSRIAAYKYGLDFTGYEIDTEYWQDQEKRFATECGKLELFPQELPKNPQK